MNSIARTGTDGARRGFGDARRRDLSAAQHAVTTARDFTRDVLADWGLEETTGSDAVLVVCELVANAAQHRGRPVTAPAPLQGGAAHRGQRHGSRCTDPPDPGRRPTRRTRADRARAAVSPLGQRSASCREDGLGGDHPHRVVPAFA